MKYDVKFTSQFKKDLKLSERTFHCPECGQTIDRDFQAALNLKHYAEKELGIA